ncbi:MAG: DUF2946 family protein [Oceanospirillaceae bacterium]|nr:DUF2946 family protein [Oceanospirillaceae bacterium]
MRTFAAQHRILLLFTLMALSVKALVPAGFMLGQSASGETIITLCTPDGSRDVYYDAASGTIRELSDKAQHQEKADHEGQACPFTTLLHAANKASSLPAVLPDEPAPAHFAIPAPRLLTRQRLTGAASPRAPPFQSFL